MISVMHAFLSQVGVFLNSFIKTGSLMNNPARPTTSGGVFSQCSDYVVSTGSHSKVFEKVADSWVEWAPGSIGGFFPSLTRYAASLDGLSVIFFAVEPDYNQKVLLYKRANTGVSFSTSTTTLLSLPTASFGAWYSLRINSTGTSIVAGNPYYGVSSGEARGRIATFIWDGSSWVLSTFDGNPGSYFGGRVSMSPNGTRLSVQRSYESGVNDVRLFVYSGFPSVPWEEVSTVSSTGTTTVSWSSETSFAVANPTNIRIYGKQVASNDWRLDYTIATSSLGLANSFSDSAWVPGPPEFIGLSGPAFLEIVKLAGNDTHKMGTEQIANGCLSYTGRTVFRAAQASSPGFYIYER